MVRVINNNLWSPVPWGWGCGGHHSCGGNNWMQKMFGYQMLFGMMNNMSNMFRGYATPPQQQMYNPYGMMGLQLGGGAAPLSYEEYMAKAEEQQSFAELKSSWSEFKISKIGDKYYAYLKSDKRERVEADSVDELMDGLNAYVDQNPDKFKSKPPKVETSEGDDPDVDPADSAGGADGAGDPPVRPHGEDGGDSVSVRATKTPIEGYEWKAFSTGLTADEKTALGLNATTPNSNSTTLGTSIDTLLEKLGLEKNDTNREILRKANPNGIKHDRIADLNRLDIPMSTTVPITPATSATPATTTPEVIDKTKSRTLNITFAIRSWHGCSGTAKVTTPDGTTHTVSTGLSWDNENARNDLGKKMVEELKAAGWRNFTLKNSNFNFSISQDSGASGSW